MDHDSMFTHYNWYNDLIKIIRNNAEASCFVPITNRIGCRYQRLFSPEQPPWNNNDMAEQRLIGQTVGTCIDEVVDITDMAEHEPFGGVMMLVKKAAWNQVKFVEKGILGIDNQFHKNLTGKGLRTYLMCGFYVYHWYRGGKTGSKQHLL